MDTACDAIRIPLQERIATRLHQAQESQAGIERVATTEAAAVV